MLCPACCGVVSRRYQSFSIAVFLVIYIVRGEGGLKECPLAIYTPPRSSQVGGPKEEVMHKPPMLRYSPPGVPSPLSTAVCHPERRAAWHIQEQVEHCRTASLCKAVKQQPVSMEQQLIHRRAATGWLQRSLWSVPA